MKVEIIRYSRNITALTRVLRVKTVRGRAFKRLKSFLRRGETAGIVEGRRNILQTLNERVVEALQISFPWIMSLADLIILSTLHKMLFPAVNIKKIKHENYQHGK